MAQKYQKMKVLGSIFIFLVLAHTGGSYFGLTWRLSFTGKRPMGPGPGPGPFMLCFRSWKEGRRTAAVTLGTTTEERMESGKRKRPTQEKNPNSSISSQKKKKKDKQAKTMMMMKKDVSEQVQQTTTSPAAAAAADDSHSSKRRKTSGGDSTFLEKMRARLSGGHFRMINEKLYTCSGKEALNYFKEDPSLFNMYHTGYQEQMSHWPEQPVNIIIKWLKSRNPSLTVADFGCGDARLAKNVKNKVFSIDLVSNDPSVIACDMSNTPLDSSSVDVAVFCLSLMGTNFPNYLQEAHRVLNGSGWLLIAEVKSRFDPNTGGADPDEFLKAVCELGFTSISKDFSNKMFLLFFFKKKDKQNSKKKKEIEWPELKPCIYKRR